MKQGWGVTKFISREIREHGGGGGRERNKIMSLKRLDDGSTFSREECRTGQSHSLFNLRSRRRYSQRLPYFLGLRPRLLIRKPEWMGSSTELG
jgi:hypothetical protein